MSNQVNAKAGLSVKDLVTTGIFTALLFVFIMVGGVFFATNPVLTFFMPAGSALLAGPVYLLMIAKVHKRWSITIMGVIMAIIWFVTGMHWAFALGYLIMAVVADFVAASRVLRISQPRDGNQQPVLYSFLPGWNRVVPCFLR